MIRIDRIHQIPYEFVNELNEDSLREWEATNGLGGKILTNSKMAWVLSFEEEPILLAGVYKTSLLSPYGELWALGLRGLKAAHVRHFGFAIEALKELSGESMLVIRSNIDEPRANKFIKLCGFERLAVEGEYNTYRIH